MMPGVVCCLSIMRGMTDYAATDVSASGAVAVTERTGATSGDTIAAGSLVVWRNAGAGTHNVTITTNNTADGLAVADQVITLTAGQVKVDRVEQAWGDANGRCAVAIDGTASEVKYLIMDGT